MLVAALTYGAAGLTTDAALAFDLQGHRGARGLAPENTLAAFRRALTEGVSTLELDIGLTRDGVVVIHHDEALNPAFARNPDGTWIGQPLLLRELDLAQLRRFDVGRMRPGTDYASRHPEQRAADGQAVPTLAELFAMVEAAGARDVRFNIETKLSPLKPERTAGPDAMVAALLEVVAAHRMQGRVTVQSFDWRTLALVQARAPAIPTIYLTARQSWLDNIDPRWNAGMLLKEHGSVPRMIKAAGGAAWSPYHGDLDKSALAEAHSLGLKVVPWTVNLPAGMERLVDLGVDGLITDRPDLARGVLERRRIAIRALF
jgi:glycerophosphoryl diester phosphodiesterase